MSVYMLLYLRSLALLCFNSLSTHSAPFLVIPTPFFLIPVHSSAIPAHSSVIPAKAGVHRNVTNLRLVDSRLRGNDGGDV